jgi:flagellar operon protein
MRINEFNRQINLLEIASRKAADSTPAQGARTESFRDTFSQEVARLQAINFSRHARERLLSRGVAISEEKLAQLSDAIDKAAQKGSKDTLILDSEAAYVASVPNRTIITAFSRANLQEGIFTSIDSAVILKD